MTWLLFGLIVWIALVVWCIIWPWWPRKYDEIEQQSQREPLPPSTSTIYRKVTDIEKPKPFRWPE